jgi:hypothetical protein
LAVGDDAVPAAGVEVPGRVEAAGVVDAGAAAVVAAAWGVPALGEGALLDRLAVEVEALWEVGAVFGVGVSDGVALPPVLARAAADDGPVAAAVEPGPGPAQPARARTVAVSATR